jgi:hypothetical protein
VDTGSREENAQNKNPTRKRKAAFAGEQKTAKVA